MLKKRGFKVVISFVLVFTFLFSFSCTHVQAADTKSVSITSPRDIIAPLEAVDSIKRSMYNSTYNYDDGSYKGTLNCTGISNWTQTFYQKSGPVSLYRFVFDVTYAGTVTKYEKPVTKEVTVTKSYNIIAPLDAVNSIKQSFLNGTYNYDDGSFKGRIGNARITNWRQTFFQKSGPVSLYRYEFNVTYSGTVTKYK